VKKFFSSLAKQQKIRTVRLKSFYLVLIKKSCALWGKKKV